MMRFSFSILTLMLLALSMSVRASLYIVGSAINTGWSRQAMTEQTEGIYTWQGYLFHGGELKFMVEASAYKRGLQVSHRQHRTVQGAG